MIDSKEYETKDFTGEEDQSKTSTENAQADTGATQKDNETDQEIINKQIEQLNVQVENLKDQLLRSIAELQNVQKRAEKEKSDIAKFSITGFAKDVLSIRDNLCLALSSCHNESNAIVEGIKMTLNHLDKILGTYDIRIIESINKQFNPNYHQAMSEVESDKESGTIVQVMQEGFMIKDRLLRPALVIIAKKNETETV